MHYCSRVGFFFITIMTLASCAVAPLNSTSTARSLGDKQSQLKVDFIMPGVMYERGLSENFDMGLGLETQSAIVANIFGKYVFINHKDDGFSLATILGIGYGVGAIGASKSVYTGPIVSYRYDWFEIFTLIRANYVRWDNDISPNDRNDLLSFVPNKVNFTYGQLDVGVSYINERAQITAGVKVLGFEKDNSSAAPFFEMGFNF